MSLKPPGENKRKKQTQNKQGAKDEDHKRNLRHPDSYFTGRWQPISYESIQKLIVGPWLPWQRLGDRKRAFACIHTCSFCARFEPACLPAVQRASVQSMETMLFKPCQKKKHAGLGWKTNSESKQLREQPNMHFGFLLMDLLFGKMPYDLSLCLYSKIVQPKRQIMMGWLCRMCVLWNKPQGWKNIESY